ncbi:sericin-2-like [Penaeus vannamei]|uniref:sericin-2-like n=1 Tax=Penaeus vannamei TaxID=6689 RepID=UPI00387F88F3
MPYDFAYGVNVESTGDVKEHKESVSPSGRTEGEYRWLQPNGLYRVTRYFVDGDGGYQASVSEEPGDQVSNYYFSSLANAGSSSSTQVSQQGFSSSQSSGNGAAFSGSRFSSNQQAFGTSQFSGNRQIFGNSQSSGNQVAFGNSFSGNQQIFGNSQSSGNQAAFGNSLFSTNQQFLGNSQSSLDQNRFLSSQSLQNQPNSQTGNFVGSSIIDGGVISGGVIDGGVIDGGVVNGATFGATNAFSDSNSFSQGVTNFQTSVADRSDINRGVAVILAGSSLPNSFRG